MDNYTLVKWPDSQEYMGEEWFDEEAFLANINVPASYFIPSKYVKPKLVCYYAHTMLSYDSTIEAQDIATLEFLGFKVLNPNTKKIQKEVSDYIDKYGRNNVMTYFKSLIQTHCDIVAFRSNPDGSILSGISAELKAAKEVGLPIIELPCSLNKRMMDYPSTKEYLIEIGHYEKEKS